MRVITTVAEMSDKCAALRAAQKAIALVPTMGFLHEGHLALCREGRRRADALCASIFVNPAQFGPKEDLSAYPRDMDGDLTKLERCGVDLVFVPEAADVYPAGYQTFVEIGEVSRGLCGASRPGHFRGVATVVLKLFNIVQPDVAIFGRKDYQQLLVIKRMVKDLDLRVEVVGSPTVREPDGLAMSSRNSYLTPEERARATSLFRGLSEARRLYEAGERDAERLVRAARGVIEASGPAQIDYIKVRRAEDLGHWDGGDAEPVMLMAVRIGKTRLIDNMNLAAPAG